MKASEAIMHMRFYLADSQKVKYSDDALLSALNLAVTLSFETFIGYASSLGRKQTTITLTDGVGDLPADFHSIALVEDASGEEVLPDYAKVTPASGYYKVVGDKIYSAADSLVLEYHYIPTAIADISSEIDCPESMTGQLVLVAVNIAKGDRMGADNAIYNMVRALAARSIPYVPDRKAFQR